MKELHKDSVVRGHHVYKSIWTPVIGEELNLECKESNKHDEYAVAVRKNGETVGHMPHSFSRISWYFLKNAREIRCVITGKRKHGLGLEVPCTYTFIRSAWMIQKLSKKMK